MYNFVIRNIANKYDYTELIKIFLSPEEFELYTEDEFDALMGAVSYTHLRAHET